MWRGSKHGGIDRDDAVGLDAMLDAGHPLLKLAAQIPWAELESEFGTPRLMLGVQVLRLVRGLPDDQVCAQWPENPYFQAFCGEGTFQNQLAIAPEAMRAWRQNIDPMRLQALMPLPAPAAPEKPATFVIDVDGVVATLTPNNDYRLCEPVAEAIAAVNRLYDRGHQIIMMTARGSKTGTDWQAVTVEQFRRWGLKYHELRFGKPAAEYYVDDRMQTIDMLCAMAAGRAFPPSSTAPRSPAR